MADKDYKNSGVPEIARYEHRRKNVGVKATVLHGYDPDTDSYYPITAIDNGDGTYSISSTGSGGGGTSAPFANYAAARQDVENDPMYFGYEDPSGDWYIKQFGFVSQTTKYVKGTGGISSNWAGRAGLSYVEYNEL